jgi:hypothetical protein|tara:strand:+ start:575 stop:841 length:267 start_codon:yes stop_codon:yes gene_type:complete
MGYINNTAQWDAKKLRKRGKLYSTIDFEVNEKVAEYTYENMPEKPIIGKLDIGGKRFNVTYPELSLIIETLEQAKKVIEMRHRMGFMR